MLSISQNMPNSNPIASLTAKVFMNGRSQAVRLPKAFRFDTDEVYIRKNEQGEVVLSDKPIDYDWQDMKEWQDLYELMMATDVPDDFMADRGLTDAKRGNIFADVDDIQ